MEETFEYYAVKRYPDKLNSTKKSKAYFRQTSGSLHTLSEWNLNALYSHLGMPWILDKIRWQGFSNKQFTESFNGLCTARNKIAHGSTQGYRLQQLKAWKKMVEGFSRRLVKEINELTNENPS